MHRPKVICFEGNDFTGKTTQCEMLRDYLELCGYNVALLKSPFNDGVTNKIIYKMLFSGFAKKFPTLFQLIQFANKVECNILLKLSNYSKCDYVILDRWKLSMLIYGSAEGVNERLDKLLYNVLLEPDLTILLTGRRFDREGKDDYEKDDVLQAKVTRGYQVWSEARSKSRVETVQCDQDVDTVSDCVLMSLVKRDLL